MKSYKVVIFSCFLLLFACAKPTTKTLELKILNKSLKAKAFNEKDYVNSPRVADSLVEKTKNSIEYSITNNSNLTVVFVPTYSMQLPYTFERKAFNSMHDVVIKNSLDKELKLHTTLVDKVFEKGIATYDSIEKVYFEKEYRKMNYDDGKFVVKNRNISKNMIVLPPKSTRYFETYLSLPYPTRLSAYKLKSDEKYTLELNLHSNATIVKQNLTNAQLKTIKENKFKIFNGTLVSQKVPIIIN